MFSFVVRRSLRLIATLVIGALLVFFALRVIPGDPATVIAGIDATPEDVQAIRVAMGTDRNMAIQLIAWLGNLLKGDMGTSLISGEPVAELIGARLPVTVTIATAAMVLSLLIALPLGVASGAGRSGAFAIFLTQIGMSVPGFWLGILLLLGFAVALPLFPLFGFDSPRHLVLPTVALGLGHGAVLLRMTRASVEGELQKEYALAARARGAGKKEILYRHILRNALPPVVALAGVQFGGLLGGAVVVEQVFSIPGMGRLLLTAVNQRDFPVVEGCVVFFAVLFSVTAWLADIIAAAANPRIVLE